MAKTNGSTIDRLNERIDRIVDLLIKGKRKGAIKTIIRKEFGAAFRTIENDIAKARERLLLEDSHVESVVGLVNTLWGVKRVRDWLASEKGVINKRSAQRIYEAAVIQRDHSAKTTASDMKAQITEVLKQIIRDTDCERTRIAACQQLCSLLGLERIKIDMTVNEESELNELANSIISDLRSKGNGHVVRRRLIEKTSNGNGNGRK